MRTALYLRVSTLHQKPDLQADGLRRYATHAALEIVAEYLDIAVSGRKEGRPQLHALMWAAHSHAFDCVLVWKFDRFARSVAHLLNALDAFHHWGFASSVYRIRWTRRAQWARPCSPSLVPWPS